MRVSLALVAVAAVLVVPGAATATPTQSLGATVPGTTSVQPDVNFRSGTTYQATVTGTSTSFRFYARGGSAAQRFTAHVYATDGSGRPTTRLGTSSEVTVNPGQPASWVRADLPGVAIAAGSRYTLAVAWGSATRGAWVYYTPATGAGFWQQTTYPATTDTWGAIGVNNERWAFALDVEPDGSGGGNCSTGIPVLPLGDSNTEGWTAVPGGYRIKLYPDLRNAAKNVDFVGPLQHGPAELADRDHAGFTGERIDQVRARIDGLMTTYRPSVVLLMLGTNDILQNYQLSTAPDRLRDLVVRISQLRAGTRVVVAQIIPRPGLDERVNAFNAAVPDAVAAARAAGAVAEVVNLNSAVDPATDYQPDSTHLTRAGFDKLAGAWFPRAVAAYDAICPPPSTGDTAAARFNWGTPLPGSDEFNYTGTPDRGKWNVYGDGGSTGGTGSNCWPGHAGNGRRCAHANTVNGEYLRQTGFANGDSAGIASKVDLKYGRWEVRARAVAEPGASGNRYHPVLITWPQSNQWPAGAEYDYLENNIGDSHAGAFLHYPNHQPRVQEYAEKRPHDLTQWHNYGFEWTAGGLVGYIDGAEWFRFKRDCIQCAPGPMHQTIQLDNFFGAGGMQRAYFDVDWARVYPAP